MVRSLRLRFAQVFCRYLPPLISARLCKNVLYPRKLAISEAAEFTTRSQTGSLYSNNTMDMFGHYFSVLGFSTWRNWAIALAVVEAGETIIEVGANVGTETIGFSDIVGARGQVYAFEPFPPLVDELNASIRQRRYDNVHVMNMALTDHEMRCVFIPPSKTNSGSGHLAIDTTNPVPDNAVEVVCTKLDALKETIGRARFICMDAEGAEPMILQGGREYIAEFKPVIIIEAAEALMKPFGYDLAQTYALFQELGYETHDIIRTGISPVNLELKHARNWVAVPSDETTLLSRIVRMIKLCGIMPCIPYLNPMTYIADRRAS